MHNSFRSTFDFRVNDNASSQQSAASNQDQCPSQRQFYSMQNLNQQAIEKNDEEHLFKPPSPNTLSLLKERQLAEEISAEEDEAQTELAEFLEDYARMHSLLDNDITRYNERIYELDLETRRCESQLLMSTRDTQKSDSQIQFLKQVVNMDFFYLKFFGINF